MSISNTGEQSGTLAAALTHAQRLLVDQPDLAAVQAEEILKVVPEHPLAALLLGQARRAQGDSAGALRVLKELAVTQPRASAVHYELGLALRDCNQNDAAAEALRRAVALKPDLSDGWRQLGDQLMLAGDLRGADDAYAQHLKASTRDPQLMAAAAALCDNRLPVAERLLRDHLKQRPTDVAAIRMLAELAGRLGRYQDAETLLVRCLELAPGFDGARYNYAIVLNRQRKAVEALAEIEELLLREPRNSGYRNLKAVVLGGIGEYEQAIEIYEQVLAKHPRQHAIWMSYGHALGTAGREQDSVTAYRRCIALAPQCGEAYWSLANLKTFRFSDPELQVMQSQLARADLSREDRLHFHFATGKAYEDQRDYAAAFDHYQSGNSQRRADLDYDADDVSALVRRSKQVLSREFFAPRTDLGSPARDPIFVVGLQRTSCPADASSPSGSRLPVTPSFKGNATARYNFGTGSLKSYAQLSALHQSSSRSALENNPQTIMGSAPAFTTFDFSVGTAKDKWTAELFVINLFDERAELARFGLCAANYCYQNARVYPAKPRLFGLRFGQKF